MITLRLDPQLEQAVHRAADHLGMSKSELIRTSILEYIISADVPRPMLGKSDKTCLANTQADAASCHPEEKNL